MINIRFILSFFFGVLIGLNSNAQIQNDSLPKPIKPPTEIQFQNYFYEGLKQKGIENYIKAIDAFVKCAELFPERAVIFFELGEYVAALPVTLSSNLIPQAISKSAS